MHDPLPGIIRKWEMKANGCAKADFIRTLSPEEFHFFQNMHQDWRVLARDDQVPPTDTEWMIWLLLGGRGAGKTRAGAEWIRTQVDNGAKRVALVAPTYNDARAVMIEGESGLLNIGMEAARPYYFSSRKQLEWPNGTIGQVFSAEDPDGLRGPQFDCAWADEFCAWEYPEDTLSNLRFMLRLGAAPRLVVTTTPKPLAVLRKLMREPGVIISRAKTADNQGNLSPAFLKAVMATYGGTRIGRQELDGEILDDHPGAFWSRDMIETARVNSVPKLDKIIVVVDPPVSSGRKSDACGIVVVGVSGFGLTATGYVIYDGTVQGVRPEIWAKEAILAYEKWGADYILAEVNQGGELINSVFAALDARVPVRTSFASKSKTARAQPVLALYERGRVKHVGAFPALEDEMCLFGAPGLRHSPDRVDALVWGLTDLILSNRGNPRARQL